MQGTIKDFDDATRSGTAVTDDRAEVAIDQSSFDDADLLTLRLGQRVTFEVVEKDGRQAARGLRLVTFAER
jgi:cold shock CspA family protein